MKLSHHGTSFRHEEYIGFLINRTAWRLRMHFQHFMKDNGCDITPEQGFILDRLWQKEGVYQTQLANATYKDKANVTRLVDALVKKGLVIRQMDAEDRRRFRIYLTDEGKALKATLLPLLVSEHEKILANISEEDLASCSRVLSMICDRAK